MTDLDKWLVLNQTKVIAVLVAIGLLNLAVTLWSWQMIAVLQSSAATVSIAAVKGFTCG